MKKIGLVLSCILFVIALFAPLGCANDNAKRTAYTIECELVGNVLSGRERVDFYNSTENAISELKFNLFGNAFREGAEYSAISSQYTAQAYPEGINYGDIKIESVECEGDSVNFTVGGVDKNVLIVPLKKEVFPDERISVEIEFTLNLARVVARTGINKNTVNLANFYPILCGIDKDGFYECVYYTSGDPFFSDCADYGVTFTCDGNYVVASSGKLVSVTENSGKTTRTYQIQSARSFALVLSSKFESITDSSTGTEITYYYYDDQNPLSSMEYAVKSLEFFSESYGEYVYPTYAVVQTEFVQGGMEYPALVMISDSLEQGAYGEVIVHETAHQWWQTAVGNNEIEYGFLDEGLAEYSVVAFYERHLEYGMKRESMIASAEKTYKIFCSVSDKIFGTVNTVMLRSLKDFKSEYEYVNMAYIKPCIMYEYLRKSIGDETFFKGLRRYYQNYKFKNATPDDLVGAFEKVGANTNGFFDSFFNGKVII